MPPMTPASTVGPRDLGGISMYWRAAGDDRRALAFAADPRRGKRGRDGLRDPDTSRDVSCNFRPPLLAGLGDWDGLVDWVDRYEIEGWQLREWNSPTYTARVLVSLIVGQRLADTVEQRRRLSEAVNGN